MTIRLTHFSEAALSNDIDYGKNRALLAWYYIDRLWTQKNSSMVPGYMKNDPSMLSNPYVREVKIDEIFPYRDLNYGEANYIQTLNLSFYPREGNRIILMPIALMKTAICCSPKSAGVA